MTRILLVLSFFATFSLNAQKLYELDQDHYRLGKIENWQNDTFWYEMTNVGVEDWFILPQTYSQDYQVLYTSRPVPPGYSTKVGLIYYTEERGPFNITVPIYINKSYDKIELRMSGTIKSIDPSALVYCPSVNNSTEYTATLPTNRLEQRFNTEKKEEQEPEDLIVFEEEEEEEAAVSEPRRERQRPSAPTPVSVDEPDQFRAEDLPNNIVLVIDKSRSMGDHQKMDNLKKSMSTLVRALRPQDKITIIYYTRVVKTLCEGAVIEDKEKLIKAINYLHPDGGSYGTKGMDMAFDLADEHYLKDGNNVIILATDGRFNDKDFSEQKLFLKAQRKHLMRGITLSGFGFGDDPSALSFLNELSQKGGGIFIEAQKEKNIDLSILKLVKNISER